MDFDEWAFIGLITLMAAIAGGVNYLKTMQTFEAGKFLIEASASGIVGLLVTLVCISMGIDQYMTGAIAGIAGFLGADVVKSIFAKFFKERTGYQIETEKEKAP